MVYGASVYCSFNIISGYNFKSYSRIFTLYPEFFPGPFDKGIYGKATKKETEEVTKILSQAGKLFHDLKPLFYNC